MGITKSSNQCRVAIIGAGNMAREHIRAFSDVSGVVISGIHSRTRSRAESLSEEFSIPAVCDSVPELFEQTEADLVILTVTETAMHPVAVACMDFPWKLLMEKPAGVNVENARQTYAAAQNKGHDIFVALNRRFLSSTRAVLKQLSIDSGHRFIHIVDQEDLVAAKSFGYADVIIDNWMYCNSVHLIDYFRIFGRGKIITVRPIIHWKADNPEIVAASVEFDSGDIGLYQAVWNRPGPWAVSVTVPENRYEMRPLEQATVQSLRERQLHPLPVDELDQKFKPGFRLQAEMAKAAVLGAPSELPTLGDALETLELVRDIYEI